MNPLFWILTLFTRLFYFFVVVNSYYEAVFGSLRLKHSKNHITALTDFLEHDYKSQNLSDMIIRLIFKTEKRTYENWLF